MAFSKVISSDVQSCLVYDNQSVVRMKQHFIAFHATKYCRIFSGVLEALSRDLFALHSECREGRGDVGIC